MNPGYVSVLVLVLSVTVQSVIMQMTRGARPMCHALLRKMRISGE